MDQANDTKMLTIHRAALISFAAATVIYLNTLANQFCFDDLSAIEQNKDLRWSTPWTNLLWNDFWGTPMHIDGSHKSYRPLCVATFRLNYLLHELQPMGYHLVNVLLHGAVCYLYVQLCGVVFSQVWPALIAGLLFAVHPIHTEAVAGIVGRAETLSSIFYLLTLFCYRRGCLDNSSAGFKWVCLSLIMCSCSVLSKEQGITAVAICFTYDVFIARNLTLWSGLKELSALKKRVPLWFKHLMLRASMLASFVMAVMVLRVKIMKAELPVFTVHDNPAVALTTPFRQLHWCYLVFVNVWLLLQPSFLCADWTMGTIPLIKSILDIRNLLTMATILSVGILSWYSITRISQTAKIIVFSLALLVFPFLPASNLFFPVGFVVAERVLYLPSMGFCMLMALGAWHLLRHSSTSSMLIKCGLVFVLLAHSAKSIQRNQAWRTDRELFVSAITINPSNGKLYNNLGHDYEANGDFATAEKLFRSAVRVQSDDIGAYINLGRTLRALGKNDEAERVYNKAVDMMPKGRSFRVAPNYINVYYNLANLIRTDTSRTVEAYELYQKALSMKPDFIEAHMNKGDLLLRMNKSADAKLSFERALQYNPDYTDAHYNLATALVQLGERREAERSYRRALSMDSGHVYSLLSLGTLLHEEGRLSEAKEFLERALSLEPNNIRASSQLAVVYLDEKDIDKSEQMLLKSLDIDPEYRSALYNLAVIYNHRKQYPEAVVLLTRLVSLYPEHINGLQLLGDCHMRQHQVEEAEKVYRKVLSQHPNHVTALHNLGVVRASGGDFSTAIDLFSRVLELNPAHEAAQKHIAEARLQQRQQVPQPGAKVNRSTTGQRPSQGQRVSASNSSHKRTIA